MPPPASASAAALWILVASVLLCVRPPCADAGPCDLSFRRGNTLYEYSLASPIKGYPHGALSEDGFYKIKDNETTIWFQLCGTMVFNHDPPRCFDCRDCGGPLHCGMTCSALIANDLGGYPVCTTLGRASNIAIGPIDQEHPENGVIVTSYTVGRKSNCSVAVSVYCDGKKAQPPHVMIILGECNYATMLVHPAGCAKVISVSGGGWGWFGTLMIIILCLFAGYILAGTTYRFFFLGIHGVEAIPNLEFWLSLPRRVRNMLGSLITRFGGRSRQGYYAPVNY